MSWPLLASGTTPQRSDTRLFLLLKILTVYQSAGGADPKNDPSRFDTRRQLLVKIERAKMGITTPA